MRSRWHYVLSTAPRGRYLQSCEPSASWTPLLLTSGARLSRHGAGELETCPDKLGSRDFLPVSQALAMETPMIGTPPAHRFRVAKFLQPPSNTHESSAAKERRRETKGVSMYSRQFPFHLVYCWSGRFVCGCVGAESSAIDSGPGSWWQGASCSARGS